jgi:hypothetical protein
VGPAGLVVGVAAGPALPEKMLGQLRLAVLRDDPLQIEPTGRTGFWAVWKSAKFQTRRPPPKLVAALKTDREAVVDLLREHHIGAIGDGYASDVARGYVKPVVLRRDYAPVWARAARS